MAYRNHVLASLHFKDLEALESHLVRVDLVKGQILTEQSAPVEDVYFPCTAYIANIMVYSDGRAVETSFVGCEGVTGLAAVMADAPCGWRSVVQIKGEAWRLSASVLRHRLEQSPDLLRKALRLMHDDQSQIAQGVGCNAIHDVGPRLARSLLHIQDRAGQQDLVLTQGDMATIIGVQRTTINAAAAALRAAGAIGYRRGVVSVRDRPLLERLSCECYAAARERSRALGVIAAP